MEFYLITVCQIRLENAINPTDGRAGVNPDLRIAGTRAWATLRLRPIKDRRRSVEVANMRAQRELLTPTLTGSVVPDAASDRMAVPKIATAAERDSEGRQNQSRDPKGARELHAELLDPRCRIVNRSS